MNGIVGRTVRAVKNLPSAIVALGGGGARGLAHFGSLQALETRGWHVRRVVGTSMGSLVGAVWATSNSLTEAIIKARSYLDSDAFAVHQSALCGASPTQPQDESRSSLLSWYDQIKNYLWAHRLLSRVFRRRSLLGGKVLTEVVTELLPDIDIRETIHPLSIVAIDLKSGRQIVLERGSLRKAVLGSAAIPGIFPPIVFEDMLLSDFGVLRSLPTDVARSYQSDSLETIVGSDVGPSLATVDDCPSALHVLLRMDEIGERLLRSDSRDYADVLIRPKVSNRQWFDFSAPQELIQLGHAAGMEALSRLPVSVC